MPRCTAAVLRVVLVCICVGSALAVSAASTVDLAQCASKRDDSERLKCYDELANNVAPVAEPPVAAKTENAADANAKATRDVIEKNMELSYITFGSGQQFGRDQTDSNMLYEAHIFKNFAWFEGSLKHVNYWVDVPVGITLRQFTDPSWPVRTPSFNPGLRVYASAREDGPLDPARRNWYYSFGLHHYSNGQDSPSLLADGSVNTRNGSFTTNYAEAAAHVAGNMGELRWARLALRQDLYGTWDAAQREQYPKRQLALELRSREYFASSLPTQLRLTETFGWGYQYVVKNDVDPRRNVEAQFRDRLHTTLELIARPNFGWKPFHWNDVALYLRYDYGYDYYNINFQNRINRLQFGLAASVF